MQPKPEETDGKIRLHLMCGGRIVAGWINIDKFNPQADLLKDVLELDYPESSVDTIFWHHGIEHLYYPQGAEMLKKIHKWLKVGGTAYLALPDLQWACQKYRNGESWRVFRNLLYGVIEMGEGWQHYSGYDDYLMSLALRGAGWKDDEFIIDRRRRWNLRVYLTKKYA
jgi:hypothetical protein